MVKDGKWPLVNIIVLTHNNAGIIGDCLRSVINQVYPQSKLNIMVVDNASSDDSVAVVKNSFSTVQIIKSAQNRGFSGGNNLGIKTALENPGCKYVVLLNSDARLERNWLKTLVSYAQAHPNGAGFQGLTLNYYNHNKVDSRGLIVNRMGLAVQIGYTETKKKRYTTGRVFGVNAAAAMYSRHYLETQPFKDYLDEDLFMYLEDVDISFRALAMGWSNYFVSDAIAYHMGSASRRKFWSTRLLHRNSWLILLKNLPTRMLLKVTKSYIKQELKIYGRYIKEGDWLMIFPALYGKAQSLLLIPAILAKRKQMRPHFSKNAQHIWKFM